MPATVLVRVCVVFACVLVGCLLLACLSLVDLHLVVMWVLFSVCQFVLLVWVGWLLICGAYCLLGACWIDVLWFILFCFNYFLFV